jgi:hypothetical protein
MNPTHAAMHSSVQASRITHRAAWHQVGAAPSARAHILQPQQLHTWLPWHWGMLLLTPRPPLQPCIQDPVTICKRPCTHIPTRTPTLTRTPTPTLTTPPAYTGCTPVRSPAVICCQGGLAPLSLNFLRTRPLVAPAIPMVITSKHAAAKKHHARFSAT